MQLTYGVIGILDRMREPNAGVGPQPRGLGSDEFPLYFAAELGVSSTSRRNCVLFMIRGGGFP